MNDYTTFPIGRQDAEVYFGDGGRDCPGAAVVNGVQPFQIGGGTGHPQGVPLRTGIQGIWTAILIVIHVIRIAIVVINTGWPGAAMCI